MIDRIDCLYIQLYVAIASKHLPDH